MLPLWGGGRRSSQQAKPRATFRGGSRGLDEALPEPWHAGYGPLPLPTCTCAAGVLCQHTWSFLWGQWLDGNIHSIEYQAKSLTTNNKMFNASTSTPDWTTESAFTHNPWLNNGERLHGVMVCLQCNFSNFSLGAVRSAKIQNVQLQNFLTLTSQCYIKCPTHGPKSESDRHTQQQKSMKVEHVLCNCMHLR